MLCRTFSARWRLLRSRGFVFASLTAPGYLIPRRWRSNLSFCAEAVGGFFIPAFRF